MLESILAHDFLALSSSQHSPDSVRAMPLPVRYLRTENTVKPTVKPKATLLCLRNASLSSRRPPWSLQIQKLTQLARHTLLDPALQAKQGRSPSTKARKSSLSRLRRRRGYCTGACDLSETGKIQSRLGGRANLLCLWLQR